jgi:CHAT domain-containing protein
VRRGFDVERAAVVYPILLKNRIEVLIETGGTLRRFSAPVTGGEATQTTRRLRLSLEQVNSGDSYLSAAQSLYRWLVRDAEPWLLESKVDTLVFIPSGALRTVPLGALHACDQPGGCAGYRAGQAHDGRWTHAERAGLFAAAERGAGAAYGFDAVPFRTAAG